MLKVTEQWVGYGMHEQAARIYKYTQESHPTRANEDKRRPSHPPVLQATYLICFISKRLPTQQQTIPPTKREKECLFFTCPSSTTAAYSTTLLLTFGCIALFLVN